MMFHLSRRHSILLSVLGLAALSGATMARAEGPSIFGRWTVSDEKPAFSAKGKLYKTIDVAPCSADFCGVSVSDKGACGPTLFRFFTAHAKDEELTGHGMWGSAKKKLMIYMSTVDDKPQMLLGVGADDFNFEARDGSMASFQANYKTTGSASCTAK
ncbi:hypothetical protein [Aestuariivirga litoralis]|uniref:hypothetical protein n=1 Tax=Aestuariivirga litoralis TaxID=2650924 RepID=UPI0018C4C45A|nr:hypothetical protein [Aestuariivirga litoralis]MBG1230911.1 hypothetical protein [Aestuariivirga litoralis]